YVNAGTDARAGRKNCDLPSPIAALRVCQAQLRWPQSDVEHDAFEVAIVLRLGSSIPEGNAEATTRIGTKSGRRLLIGKTVYVIAEASEPSSRGPAAMRKAL